MIELCRCASCRELGAAPRDVRAVCVGVPGGVDDARGMVDTAPNLGWAQVPLVERLSTALGVARVFLDNDVRVAVLGEHAYGVGKGTRTMVGIFVGTGIGGGIIVGHHTHHGGRGVAGEIGHMTLLPHGPRCGCGKRGCVEALASAHGHGARRARAHQERLEVEGPQADEEGRARHLTSSVIEQGAR